MRLIDVTDLKKFIRENVCAIGDDHLLLVAGDDGRWHEALPLIQTAYDIDKVVEELNELDVKSITRYKNGNFGDFDGVEYYIKKRKVIEIVKQGGVGKVVE